MTRPKVAILFGGCSEEHDVSVKSAMAIAASIDVQRYEPIYVGITKAGAWRTCDRPAAGWEHGEGRRAVISPDRAAHGLLVAEGGGWRTVPVDVVFPVLHGRTGEDGAVQGLLELSGIPYVGCGIQSSAICMDKSLAYLVARSAGIDTPELSILTGDEDALPSAMAYPVFVKPARSGSSFGVTRVDHPDELGPALAAARAHDSKVLVEEAIAGTEVGCAVLGRGPDLLVGEVDQIQLSHGFFRIHQEDDPEHGSENAVVTVPADLPEAQRQRIQETARSIYRALGCDGLARVDMFLQGDGRIVLNEVNTLPGFTAYSRYPRMMAAAGIPLAEVIDRCIALAMAP
jgi:D-alanine--(R)-lactate ligase